MEDVPKRELEEFKHVFDDNFSLLSFHRTMAGSIVSVEVRLAGTPNKILTINTQEFEQQRRQQLAQTYADAGDEYLNPEPSLVVGDHVISPHLLVHVREHPETVPPELWVEQEV